MNASQNLQVGTAVGTGAVGTGIRMKRTGIRTKNRL
jgi:hypothetical protein